ALPIFWARSSAGARAPARTAGKLHKQASQTSLKVEACVRVNPRIWGLSKKQASNLSLIRPRQRRRRLWKKPTALPSTPSTKTPIGSGFFELPLSGSMGRRTFGAPSPSEYEQASPVRLVFVLILKFEA